MLWIAITEVQVPDDCGQVSLPVGSTGAEWMIMDTYEWLVTGHGLWGHRFHSVIAQQNYEEKHRCNLKFSNNLIKRKQKRYEQN